MRVSSGNTNMAPSKANQSRSKNSANSEISISHNQTKVKGHNVWYRGILQLVAPEGSSATKRYRDAFQQRIVHPVGVPVDQLHGIHGLFDPSFGHYSLLHGMIFAHNNFVNNLYRYYGGDGNKKKDNEPTLELIQHLFNLIPGGEIQTTHAGRNAGAHLSPESIGNVFEAFENAKPGLLLIKDEDELQAALAHVVLKAISDSSEYQASTAELRDEVTKAEALLQELEAQKEQQGKLLQERIHELEVGIIKPNSRQTKKLKKDQKKATSETRRQEIDVELAKLKEESERAMAEMTEHRAKLPNAEDFKVARKNIRVAQEDVEAQQQSLDHLAVVLARSLIQHELNSPHVVSGGMSFLPAFSTVAVLLSYLWRKYDSIKAFEGYFAAMRRIGAISKNEKTCLDLVDCDDSATNLAQASAHHNDDEHAPHHDGWYRVPMAFRDWPASLIENITTMTTTSAGNSNRPPVIQFSYVTWAAYSEFPDCGENVIRNLFNQMLYNPETKQFDHELLVELKNKFYPDLSDRLIEFYKRHNNPKDAGSGAAAADWIKVVSGLNTMRGLVKDSPDWIKYHRGKEEANISSPLRNLLKSGNALFVKQGMGGPHVIVEVAERINELRGWNTSIDLSRMASDGYGILDFSDGQVHYELQSHKPLHFSFVQAKQQGGGNHGGKRSGIHPRQALQKRSDYKAFWRLMKKTNRAPTASPNTSEYFQQLSLASLFVPLQVQHGQVGKLFQPKKRQQHGQAHLFLLFSDLESETIRQEALRLVSSNATVPSDTKEIKYLADAMEAYVEPTFRIP